MLVEGVKLYVLGVGLGRPVHANTTTLVVLTSNKNSSTTHIGRGWSVKGVYGHVKSTQDKSPDAQWGT